MNEHSPVAHVASAVTADVTTLPEAAAQRPGPQLNQTARMIAESLSREPISPILVAGLVRLAEVSSVLLFGVLIYVLYVEPVGGIDWYYAAPIVGGSLLTVLIIQLSDGHSIPALRHPPAALGRVLAAWTSVFVLFTVIAFLAKIGDYYSRVWIGSWYLSGLIALTLVRFGSARLVRSWTQSGRLERRAVVVGGGEAAARLIEELQAQPDNDIRICGVFDDRKDDRSPPVVAGFPKLGTFEELVAFGRIARIDMLIVTLPVTAEGRLLQLLKKLWVLPVDIRLSAHAAKLRFRPRAYSFLGTVPLFDVFDKPIADWDRIAKRVFDLFFASLAIVALLPVMAITAVLIRLDSPGPIVFRQKRYGFNNEMIEIYKFRSMYTHMSDAKADKLVTRDDPRVTPIGRFIRKTSIDELPQLFNVLRGQISLVGPRPHATNAKADSRLYENVVDGYFARHRVKPGITGWAQVNGWRGGTDTAEQIEQRVKHDLYYIENWSLLLDLQILFMTPFKLLQTENAY